MGNKASVFAVSLAALTSSSSSACSRSNNVLLGEVQAKVGSHEVRVTDCYRTSVAPPREIREADGKVTYRFTPCQDADIEIRDEQFQVNGVSYGHVDAGDGILVDHGSVSINRGQSLLSPH